MNPPSIALITAQAARTLDDDLAPLEDALRALHADVTIVEWDDTKVDWSRFDLALIRSTWDYTVRLSEFLDWTLEVSTRTVLVNPAKVVRWNTDKHYLRDLANRGVATVPGEFVEVGEDPDAGVRGFLARHSSPEFVVKPSVGAGSRDARRHAASDLVPATNHVRSLLDSGRTALLQPYLDRVDDVGETALIHFAGEFSHAIRKGPLLRRGEEPTRALFATESISARDANKDEIELAATALRAIPGGVPLYARVDVIRNADGTPCILELELTEPSLFFAFAPGSAERFASAIVRQANVLRRK